MPGEDFIQSKMTVFDPRSQFVPMARTTVNGTASSVTQTFASTAGFADGDKIYFETTGAERTILSVDSATHVTLTATISTTGGETVRHNRYVDIELCGLIQIDGAQGSLYLSFSDILRLEGRMWIIYSKAGDTFNVACTDATTFNDGLTHIAPPAASSAIVVQCLGGRLYAWTWALAA